MELLALLSLSQVEQSEYSQAFKFLELLPDQGPNTFNLLLDTLKDGGHSWVSQEMRVDLLAEKGQLDVEEYVHREAGVIVHRQFGQSKRISETDKKEIQLLLALRYQAAKEAWYEQMMKAQNELKEALNHKWKQNGRLKGLAEKVTAFMRIQQKRVNEHAHDVFHGVDLTREDMDPESNRRDYYDVMEHYIDKVLEVLSKVLLEKENLSDERSRCLEILKIDSTMLQLDVALEDALLRAADDIFMTKEKATHSDTQAQSLDARMKSLKMETDRDLTEKQRRLMYLESVGQQKEDHIRQLEKMVTVKRVKQSDTQDELNKWKKKCQMLEKTRRLGYYNPGRYNWYTSLVYTGLLLLSI